MPPDPATARATRMLADNARWAVGLAVAGAGLWAVFVALATGAGGAGMANVSRLMMPSTAAWSPAAAGAVFAMWAVMMAAMMLPSALPMVLTFAGLNRGGPGPVAGFALAYLAVWAGFGLAATALQWVLQAAGLVSAMGAATTPWAAAGLLAAAGAVQFTSLKQACLAKCRTPVGFLVTEWREGAAGAVRMGVRHGVFCVGCCWAIMLLPFVAGTMNMVWMVVLTLLVAAEKIVPFGPAVSRAIGAGLIAAGLAVALAA